MVNKIDVVPALMEYTVCSVQHDVGKTSKHLTCREVNVLCDGRRKGPEATSIPSLLSSRVLNGNINLCPFSFPL